MAWWAGGGSRTACGSHGRYKCIRNNSNFLPICVMLNLCNNADKKIVNIYTILVILFIWSYF